MITIRSSNAPTGSRKVGLSTCATLVFRYYELLLHPTIALPAAADAGRIEMYTSIYGGRWCARELCHHSIILGIRAIIPVYIDYCIGDNGGD